MHTFYIIVPSEYKERKETIREFMEFERINYKENVYKQDTVRLKQARVWP